MMFPRRTQWRDFLWFTSGHSQYLGCISLKAGWTAKGLHGSSRDRVTTSELPGCAQEYHRSLSQDITRPLLVRKIGTNDSDHPEATRICLDIYVWDTFLRKAGISRSFIQEDRFVRYAFLNTIHRPGMCLRLQVEPTELRGIREYLLSTGPNWVGSTPKRRQNTVSETSCLKQETERWIVTVDLTFFWLPKNSL
jgi:hypothetical protein